MSLACIAHEVGRIKPAAMPEQRKPGFRFVTCCILTPSALPEDSPEGRSQILTYQYRDALGDIFLQTGELRMALEQFEAAVKSAPEGILKTNVEKMRAKCAVVGKKESKSTPLDPASVETRFRFYKVTFAERNDRLRPVSVPVALGSSIGRPVVRPG